MKKYSLYILLLSLLVVSMSSCKKDFLVKTPPDALPEDGFYNSSERAVAAINAAYTTLMSDDLYGNYFSKIFTGASGDAILSNTNGSEFTTFSYVASDDILMTIYSRLYEGVYRSNLVLQKVPDIDMDAGLKNRILAEAKFLRALYYWHLTTLWGEVPLFTQPFETPDDALIAKSPIKDIYAVMIQDLEDAIAVLPVSYSGADVGRATKGAAQALLGKVYLYDKDYENAEKWLGTVISSGTYALDDNFDDIINRNHENDEESIFEVQYKQVGSGDVQTLRDAYNLPQGEPGGVGNDLPTQSIVDAFEDYNGPTAINGKDPRLFYTVFRDGDPFAPHLNDPALAKYDKAWSITGYNLRKGMVPILLTNNGGTNFPVIRYADVLLMYAEAANELDLRDKARDAVNEVRQRPSVGMPKLTVAQTDTKQKMFDAIVHERRVELAFEYHRYNDLRRWGLAQKYLGPNGYTDRDRYLPLPQEEIDTNPNLVQLDGW
jgi:hypothetical protein